LGLGVVVGVAMGCRALARRDAAPAKNGFGVPPPNSQRFV
jgi:hypothetical protein